MSGVRMSGRMPSSRQIMGVMDAHARIAVTEAKNVVVPVVKAEAPGGLGAAMTGSVRKTPTGFRLVVQAAPRKKYRQGSATGAQVVRWVNRGTGVYRKGPGAKRRIASKTGGPMTLPGGRAVLSVKGQKPNEFIARGKRRADPMAREQLREGARQAANELRRLR